MCMLSAAFRRLSLSRRPPRPPPSPRAFHAHLASLAEPSRASYPATLPSLLAALSRARVALLPLLPAIRALAASELLCHGRLVAALAHFCNSLLAALASSGSLADARKVFDRMLVTAAQLDTVGLGVFVKNVGRRDELDESLRLVDAVHHQGDLINRIVSEGFRIAERAEEEGRILEQKRKLGVAPRKVDYREILLKLVSNRKISEAKEMAEAIVSGDFPIDDDSVSEIDPDAATMFCKFMIGQGRLPSIEMLVQLCENFCKNKKGDEMWEMFMVLLGKGYWTSEKDYHLVVSFLGKAGKVREAYGVIKEIKRKRLDPGISSYNCLMVILCRNDLLRPAKKLWDEMFTSGCSANLQTYNIFIMKFAEIDESGEVQQLFDHMLQKGVAPDGATYTSDSVITMLCQENRYEQAEEIFNKSAVQDPKLANSVLPVFSLALCKQGSFKAALNVVFSVPSNIESSNAHVILLKCLTDAEGLVDEVSPWMKLIDNEYA
ncbi:unnamed protein product [Alopecurus aequalis]